MILILTDRNDSHAKTVIQKIVFQKLNHYILNVDVESLRATTVTYRQNKWVINQEDRLLDLTKLSCVWNRRTFVELLLEEENDQSVDFKIWKNEWNKTLLGIYSSIRHLPWLNHWRQAYKAENKYLQMELAHANNLLIPATVISNSKIDLLGFIDEYKNVALKLMQQDFYKTSDGVYKGFYVNKITAKEMERFQASHENPIVLQEYIEKEFEVRYTVVGQQHFVCKIDSQKSTRSNVDWRRYDIPNTPHTIIDPPESIKNKVEKLMADLGIEYGALDFIVDKKGEWIFLEVNSMGQFLWIEELTGLGISDEIINWLKKFVN